MKISGINKVSVVVTVLNEEGSISRLIEALNNQTLPPSEIIVVDGGSTDRTWSLLQKNKSIKSFRVLGNRSLGRNFGISKSHSPIIALTDAGCYPDPNWLEEIFKPFMDKSVQVVSGYYRGMAENIFQKCLIPYVLVMPDAAEKREFFPSTRSMALRKTVWFAHKFNENLWHNEDYAYAHQLKNAGYNFMFCPKAMVSWQPRRNLKSAAWMFMRFAIGDIQAGIIRPQVKKLALRYLLFTYLVMINAWFLLLLAPYVIWSILKNFKYVRDLRAIYWLPVLQLTADASVLFGSIVGFLSRL